MVDFEWDSAKNEANVAKHGIGFDKAIEIFASSAVIFRSNRKGENRWGATGALNGEEITVFFTIRGTVYRIISARRARRDERRAFGKAHPGG
jgi:uncharacterized protein